MRKNNKNIGVETIENKISIILPVFNEQDIIGFSLYTLCTFMHKYLENSLYDFEVIVVDDCSTDKSREAVNAFMLNTKHAHFSPLDMHFIQLPVNKGKGGAIKAGLEKAKGDVIIVLDADLSTDLSSIKQLVENVVCNNFDYVLTSRYMPNSHMDIPPSLLRRFYSRVFNRIVRLLFDVDVYDSQNGCFALSSRFAEELLRKSLIDRFSFNVEWLLIALDNGYSSVEIPCKWSDNKPKKASIRQIKEMFLDLIRIKKYQMKGRYR